MKVTESKVFILDISEIKEAIGDYLCKRVDSSISGESISIGHSTSRDELVTITAKVTSTRSYYE